MMENGKHRKRRQLSPEEKWEIFLAVTSQEISQADAAREWHVDVSVIIRLRALAKDAALAAFASAKPGRTVSAEAVEVELLRGEVDRLYLHRSWTGHAMFEAELRTQPDAGADVTNLSRNADRGQFNMDDAAATDLFDRLLTRLASQEL